MRYSKNALALFFVTAAATSLVGGTQQHHRGNERLLPSLSSSSRRNNKTSKKAGGEGDGAGMVRQSSLEGTYQYLTRDDTIVQVTIGCGDDFGEDDPDLCLWSEFSQGTVLTTPETGSEPLPGEKGLHFLPDPALPDDGTINPDTMCVFSGTFRRSSSMVEEEDGRHKQFKLKAIPLASSNGCKNLYTNFQMVVKATMKKAEDEEDAAAQDSDGTILELDVSDDFGATYYTDNEVCPHTYVAWKVLTKEEEEKKSGHTRARFDSSDDFGSIRVPLNIGLCKTDRCNAGEEPERYFFNSSLQVCVRSDRCPTNCGADGNGRQCCIDKGITTGLCKLNGPGNTCECTTIEEQCTIQMSCPDDCGESDDYEPQEGSPGYGEDWSFGKECCRSKGVTGLCYLNEPGNECKCKRKTIGKDTYEKDPKWPCLIEM